MSGKVAMTLAAAISPHGSLCSPAKRLMATGTVRFSGDEVNVSA
jgi:hypothetical protein